MKSAHDLIEEFVSDRLARNDKGAHTLDHTKRVFALSIKIGKELGADLKILGAAALLPEVGGDHGYVVDAGGQ